MNPGDSRSCDPGVPGSLRVARCLLSNMWSDTLSTGLYRQPDGKNIGGRVLVAVMGGATVLAGPGAILQL